MRWFILAFALIVTPAHAGNLNNNAAPAGWNVNPLTNTYYSPDWWALNVFKMSTGWITSCGSCSFDTAEEKCLQLDANGYLTTLAPNTGVSGCSSVNYTYVTTYIYLNAPGNYPGGLYDVYYDDSADGTISYIGDASCSGGGASCPGTGHDLINVATPSTLGIGVRISAISGSSYPQNFRLVQHAYASSEEAGEIFNPYFLAMEETGCGFRILDWWQVNGTTISDPSQIVNESYAFWSIPAASNTPSLQNGLTPVSVLYKLANEADIDIWLNVPGNFTDAAVTSVANTLHANLTKNQWLYEEWGDEPWNTFSNFTNAQGAAFWAFNLPGTATSGSPTIQMASTAGLAVFMQMINSTVFPGGGAQIKSIVPNVSVTMYQNASANGSYSFTGPGTAFTTGQNYYGVRSQQICNDIKTAWGSDSSRVICTMNAQYNNTGVIDSEMACAWYVNAPCTAGIDAISQAWYLGGAVPHNFVNDSDGGLDRYFRQQFLGNAIPPVTESVTFNSTATATPTDTTGLIQNMVMSGTGCTDITAGTTVDQSVVYGAGTVHMSNAASASGTQTCTFTLTSNGTLNPFIANMAAAVSHNKTTWGVPTVGYEGGQNTNYSSGDTALNAMYDTAWLDPRSATFVQQGIQGWINAGGRAFFYYSDVGDEPYGSLTDLYQYNLSSPASSNGARFVGQYNYATSRAQTCHAAVFGGHH